MGEAKFPKRKRIRLSADAYHKSTAWFFVTICCKEKKPLLASPVARDLVVEVLRRTAAALHVEMAVYTVLPNHMHLICSAGSAGLIDFVREFKSRTAVQLIRVGAPASPWQARFFDHKLRSHESTRRKCEYVWMNPVRRRLVSRPEDYRWTGALLTG
ncbi:MAG: REP-associated tyrosine transposase [Candidatus Acidiferrales bacterium]